MMLSHMFGASVLSSTQIEDFASSSTSGVSAGTTSTVVSWWTGRRYQRTLTQSGRRKESRRKKENVKEPSRTKPSLIKAIYVHDPFSLELRYLLPSSGEIIYI